MDGFFRLINGLNRWLGSALGFLLLPMMGIICFEVVSRYFFNRPTIWAMDVSTYVLCIYTLLGGGFTLLRASHVKVDILYGRFPPRTKGIIDCLTSFFFFIFTVVLIWWGWEMFRSSLTQGETSATILDWPLYPTKLMVPLGAGLLFLQGVVKFICDLRTAVTGRPPILTEGEHGVFARE
jgi:TRAP-type mannitol/chloroaromatic compound transport system permease small subunit